MGNTLTFDFETRDPNIKLKKGAGWVYKDFDVLGVAYKLDANPSQFTTDMGTFRDIVGRSQIIIAHNAQYDVGCLNRLDIPYADKTIIDTAILAKLYDNTIQSYSLDSLSTSFFGENKDYASLLSAYAVLKTEEHTETLASKPGNRIFDVEGKRYLAIKVPAAASLEDVKLGFQRAQQNPKDKSVPFTSVFDLDGLLSQYKDTVLKKTSTSNAMSHIADIFKRFPDIVAKYAKKDVDLTYQLYMFFKENLYHEGLALIDFYSDLIKALVKWRRKGVKLDMDQVALSREALQLCEKESMDHFRSVAGVETCNFNSTAEMAEIFTRLGIQVGTSKTGEPSVCKEWRELQTHPMVACFSDIKTYSKLYRDFIDGLTTKMENGRIYPEINILGAAETGRFSSCVPMDTQALTRKGWKSYEQLEIGEDILAYDIKTDTQRWTPLLRKQKFEDQEVGVIGNDRTSFECTANHRFVNDNGWYKDTHYLDFQCADEFKNHHAIKVNAKYEGGSGAHLRLDLEKYGTSWTEKVLSMTLDELSAFVTGFLLADGHHATPTTLGEDNLRWQFTKVSGEILDALHLAAYLLHDKRISRNRNGVRAKESHRQTYRVVLTTSGIVVTSNVWKPTRRTDVWCPTTMYGTWVMKQGDHITITGNSNPNIQQIPKRSPNAKSLIRGIFSAEPGENWYSLDFSSQEPRLQVHYAFLAGCSGADVLRDAFHKNPTYDLHQKVADMASIDRKTAKTINLGISYGMGVARLASSLKIDKAEASALRKQYNKASPYLNQLNNAVKKSGVAKGYIRTVLGRRLRMDYDLPYKSLNKLIQGSAADQTAMAMVMAYREGLDISFSVHDELNFSSKSPKDALRLKEIMETCVNLSVPSYTEIMTGPSWGSLTPL